jgi:hypothetical protein
MRFDHEAASKLAAPLQPKSDLSDFGQLIMPKSSKSYCVINLTPSS